eukprot:GHVH01001240.1.p2 GENE.GHVH01001240.1~~GHVH01001240.1.p2  ORF type:complete len:139 (+),score=33.27 GHVH01001240.1:182-598(+)
MSSKFYERLLKSNNVSSKKVKCSFAEKMMEKMGWKEGAGLGKDKQGSTEVLQVKIRKDGQGLGVEDDGEKRKKELYSNWWDTNYATALSDTKITAKKLSKKDLRKLKKSEKKKEKALKKQMAAKKTPHAEDEDSLDFL